MADSIAPIFVGKNYLNISTQSGIAAGTAVTIQNIGAGIITLSTRATQPTTQEGLQLEHLDLASIPSGESDVWAKCSVGGGKITVQEG